MDPLSTLCVSEVFDVVIDGISIGCAHTEAMCGNTHYRAEGLVRAFHATVPAGLKAITCVPMRW